MRFASEMDGAAMTKVDPKLCVYFMKYRGEYRDGIETMKRISRGRGLLSDCSSDGNVNAYARVDAPIVIAVTDYYRPYFGRSPWEKGLTKDKVQQFMTSDEMWIGVMDGSSVSGIS